MKRFFIFFAIFCSFSVFGQTIPFPMDSATWIMDIVGYGAGFPPQTSHNYSRFSTNGDTLINGFTYTKIRNWNNPNYCYLRTSNDSVYCKYDSTSFNDTTEFLLYRFNYTIGENINLQMAGPSHGTHFGQVDNIDSLLIGNRYHKRIWITSWISFQFVEGVGALQGLLYPEIPWVDHDGFLTCFSRNDTVFKTDGSGQYSLTPCSIPTSIEESTLASNAVWPNPMNNSLQITWSPTSREARLLDIHGRRLHTISREMNNIDVSHLQKGVYFIQLFDKDGWHTQKLIKQ